MNRFSKISSIDVRDERTWTDELFLTFDIDWAHDLILQDSIELIESAGAAATWFVTHDTLLLERLKSNPKFELGIHPNFNFLLNGDSRNGSTAQEVVDRLINLIPYVKSIRSHSITQSSVLLDIFEASGLTHDVNHFIPAHTGMELVPWVLWNGLVRVPYFWADDVACMCGPVDRIDKLTTCRGLKVLNFHPIHVFLNTEDLSRYESTRHLHQNPSELIKYRYEGEGTRTRLLDLIKSGGGV